MLQIETFKHGEFRGIENLTHLKTIEDVENWVNNSVEYTEQIKSEESECGESLCKWTARFKFNGQNYITYLDA